MSKYEPRDRSARLVGTSQRIKSDSERAYQVGAGIGTGIGLAAAAFGAMNNSVDKASVQRFEEHLDAERYDAAIQEIDQLISRHKQDGGVYVMRAVAYARSGRYQEAIRDIDSAFGMSYGLDNYRDTAHFIRAEANARLGKWRAAQQDLSSAIKIAPDNGKYWLKRGIATLEIGDTEQARFNISKAIELDPGVADGYYQRARVHLTEGNAAAAQTDIQRALKLERGKPAYFSLQSEISGALGDTSTGESLANRAPQLQEDLHQRAESARKARVASERETAIRQASKTARFSLFAAVGSAIALGLLTFGETWVYPFACLFAGLLSGVFPGVACILSVVAVACLVLGAWFGALIAVIGGHVVRAKLSALGIDEGKTLALIALIIGYPTLLLFVVGLLSLFF